MRPPSRCLLCSLLLLLRLFRARQHQQQQQRQHQRRRRQAFGKQMCSPGVARSCADRRSSSSSSRESRGESARFAGNLPANDARSFKRPEGTTIGARSLSLITALRRRRRRNLSPRLHPTRTASALNQLCTHKLAYCYYKHSIADKSLAQVHHQTILAKNHLSLANKSRKHD